MTKSERHKGHYKLKEPAEDFGFKPFPESGHGPQMAKEARLKAAARLVADEAATERAMAEGEAREAAAEEGRRGWRRGRCA